MASFGRNFIKVWRTQSSISHVEEKLLSKLKLLLLSLNWWWSAPPIDRFVKLEKTANIDKWIDILFNQSRFPPPPFSSILCTTNHQLVPLFLKIFLSISRFNLAQNKSVRSTYYYTQYAYLYLKDKLLIRAGLRQTWSE